MHSSGNQVYCQSTKAKVTLGSVDLTDGQMMTNCSVQKLEHILSVNGTPQKTYRLWCKVKISQSIKFNKQWLHHCLDFNMLWILFFFFLSSAFLSKKWPNAADITTSAKNCHRLGQGCWLLNYYSCCRHASMFCNNCRRALMFFQLFIAACSVWCMGWIQALSPDWSICKLRDWQAAEMTVRHCNCTGRNVRKFRVTDAPLLTGGRWAVPSRQYVVGANRWQTRCSLCGFVDGWLVSLPPDTCRRIAWFRNAWSSSTDVGRCILHAELECRHLPVSWLSSPSAATNTRTSLEHCWLVGVVYILYTSAAAALRTPF